jgi:hypothetical protein
MPKRPTSEIADPNIKYGNKPYHPLAKKIIPILVKIARGNQPPITYGELGNKLGLRSGRFTALRLRWPLGSIERAIKEQLNELQNVDVPQLTSLVITKGSKLPGRGIAGFIEGKEP